MNRMVRERSGQWRNLNGRGQIATEAYRKWEIRAHRQIAHLVVNGVPAQTTKLVYIGHIDAYGFEFGTMTYATPVMVKAAIDGWWEQMKIRQGWKESDLP